MVMMLVNWMTRKVQCIFAGRWNIELVNFSERPRPGLWKLCIFPEFWTADGISPKSYGVLEQIFRIYGIVTKEETSDF